MAAVQKVLVENLAKEIANSSASLIVLDARPIAAYNGWALKGQGEGGHLLHSHAFPASWLKIDGVDDSIARLLLATKGAASSNAASAKSEKKVSVVVLGSSEHPQDVELVAETVARVSLIAESVRILSGGIQAWTAAGNKLEKFPRYELLVPSEWLEQQLDDPVAKKNLVVLHAHYGKPEDYEAGHIPEALSADTNDFEEPDWWNRRTPEELRASFLKLGVTANTRLVCVGRSSGPHKGMPKPGQAAGMIGAARLALIASYSGVKDVRYLDGGLGMWQGALTTVPGVPTPASDFGVSIPQHPEFVVDLDEALKMTLAAPEEKEALVSIRSWREFIGSVSGYNYIPTAGEISGAVWGDCGSDAYSMQVYRNIDDTMREGGELLEMWKALGITADKHVAFYCGTGWRASETWIYALVLGYPRVAVYDGGWHEWSRMHAKEPTKYALVRRGEESEASRRIRPPRSNLHVIAHHGGDGHGVALHDGDRQVESVVEYDAVANHPNRRHLPPASGPCGASSDEGTNSNVPIVTKADVEKIIADKASGVTLLDVRNPDETEVTGIIPTAHVIPLPLFPDILNATAEEWKQRFGVAKPARDQRVVVYCRSGRRSEAAAVHLINAGWKNVQNYKGSALEWFPGSK